MFSSEYPLYVVGFCVIYRLLKAWTLGDGEVPSAHLAGGVVGMLRQFGVHALQANCVCDFTDGEASFV